MTQIAEAVDFAPHTNSKQMVRHMTVVGVWDAVQTKMVPNLGHVSSVYESGDVTITDDEFDRMVDPSSAFDIKLNIDWGFDFIKHIEIDQFDGKYSLRDLVQPWWKKHKPVKWSLWEDPLVAALAAGLHGNKNVLYRFDMAIASGHTKLGPIPLDAPHADVVDGKHKPIAGRYVAFDCFPDFALSPDEMETLCTKEDWEDFIGDKDLADAFGMRVPSTDDDVETMRSNMALVESDPVRSIAKPNGTCWEASRFLELVWDLTNMTLEETRQRNGAYWDAVASEYRILDDWFVSASEDVAEKRIRALAQLSERTATFCRSAKRSRV